MTGQPGLAVSRDSSDNGTTPKGFRLAMGGLLAKGTTTALNVRKGVLWDGAGAVVSGTAGMAYSVRACAAVVMPSTTQGPVIVTNDAALSVTTTAAPGSNSRIDVIWVRQHLVSADGGADTDVIAEFGVTQGTAASSPSAPAIPSGAVELARATVTSGATTTNSLTISQTHLWTAAAGAPIPVRNNTERAALTAFAGLMVNNLTSGAVERYDGSNWMPVAAGHQSGTGTLSVPASGTAATATVTFPTPFPTGTVPVVTAVARTSVPHQRFASAYNESNTGFTVSVVNTFNTSDVGYTWRAEMPV